MHAAIDHDLVVEVPIATWDEMSRSLHGQKGEPLSEVEARIGAMSEHTNVELDKTSLALLATAYKELQLGAGQTRRIIAVARTIANLAQSEKIQTIHLAEAIQYRPRRLVDSA
jgi:magnesium chelatase family protein